MKKIILIPIIIAAVLTLLTLGFLGYFFWALNHHGQGEAKEVIIRQGQTTREISQLLKANNLIPSSWVFRIYAKYKHDLIQVGVYKLSPSQSTKEILDVLSAGKSSEYLITIPEGWRVTQIDEFLASKGIISAGDLLKVASADEGYLFPDTYRLLPKTSAKEIRQMMMDNFQRKTAGMGLTREQLILASIVEREAKFDEDRPKIAGVYLNRLERGMKLEADPTVQYAKGSWAPITTADYRSINSPYNTYLYIGLPPGPICNPGLKSIEAVIHPEKNGWLYFFQKTDGQTVFSATLEEHQENLKKYQ